VHLVGFIIRNFTVLFLCRKRGLFFKSRRQLKCVYSAGICTELQALEKEVVVKLMMEL